MSRRLRILDGDSSDDDRVTIDVVKRRKRGKEKDPSICHELMMDVWIRRAMLVGLHVDALRRLISFGVPPVLFGVMAYIARSRHFNGEDLDYVEFFSGKGMLSQGLADEGWRGIAIDLINEPYLQNLMTPEGLLSAISLIMRLLTALGFNHSGTVCSSWVCRVGKSQTGLSKDTPLGWREQPCVEHANVMVARASLLQLLCVAKLVTLLVEQPSSSIMDHHPRFRQVTRLARWKEVRFSMLSYGAATLKPSKCWGTGPWLPQLAELGRTWVPPEDRKALATSNANGSITGNKDLKDSQTYPRAFGQSIGLCYSHWRRAPNHVIQELATDEQPMDMWEDAELESLASLCGVPTNRYPWE